MPSAPASPPSSEANAVRLMVVEDEFVVAIDLREALADLGYAVVASVGTGEEAVEIARKVRPAAILMDIRLAGAMDGVEAAARIRNESDIPIIFLSAHSSEETIQRAAATHPFGYLIKPFRSPELRSTIEVALRKHAAERQQAADQLRRLDAEVKRHVAERTGALEAANRELEAFSYSVAHDLRAPLRSIAGFSDILAQDHAAELGTEGLEFLLNVQRSAGRMNLLIEDLLRLSKISGSELDRGPVDLSRIAHHVLDRLRAADAHRSVTVDVADQVLVHGDERLLELVIENLLGNAWKFTSKREEALIEVGKLRQGDQDVYFVRDNGAGFDPGDFNKLFTAFQRFHSMSEFEGTGLGLTIVQRILERHGGRIWAESAIDAGATFYFTL